MIPAFLQTCFHSSDIQKICQPLLIRQIAVIHPPGMNHRINMMKLCANSHRLIRQRRLNAQNRIIFKVIDRNIIAQIVQIAHRPQRCLLETRNICLHILYMNGIQTMTALSGHHRCCQLHVVITGRIGCCLRSFFPSELLIRILPVKHMNRITGHIDSVLPFLQIKNIILCQDLFVSLICKENLQCFTIIIHNTQRFIRKIINAAQSGQI